MSATAPAELTLAEGKRSSGGGLSLFLGVRDGFRGTEIVSSFIAEPPNTEPPDASGVKGVDTPPLGTPRLSNVTSADGACTLPECSCVPVPLERRQPALPPGGYRGSASWGGRPAGGLRPGRWLGERTGERLGDGEWECPGAKRPVLPLGGRAGDRDWPADGERLSLGDLAGDWDCPVGEPSLGVDAEERLLLDLRSGLEKMRATRDCVRVGEPPLSVEERPDVPGVGSLFLLRLPILDVVGILAHFDQQWLEVPGGWVLLDTCNRALVILVHAN